MEASEIPLNVRNGWPADKAETNRILLRPIKLSMPPLKEGYLTKRGHFVKNWKRRWYRMADGLIMYFRSHKDTMPAGCVPLRNATIQPAPAKLKKKFCFEVCAPDGSQHYAFASSETEMQSWIDCIRQWIDYFHLVGYSAEDSYATGLDDAESAKISIDDFELLQVLGKGSFGKVMLARKKGQDQLFAIKILKKDVIVQNEELEHTQTERRVLQSVRHPFLVRLYYSFQSEDRLYFVMDYVNGGELFYHMQREGRFDEARARYYLAEIVCAIGYLHRKGIVYRDLKLENLLLDTAGHVLVTDFGLCKEGLAFGNTTNTFCGTPEYLAPEIVEDADYGTPVDWWSVGIVGYEMMTGRSPFNAADHESLFREILEAEIYYPPTLSAEAVDLLKHLLEREPKRRLGSGPSDSEEIKAHAFFDTIDFAKLEAKELPPPFVPQVAGATDTSNFDPMFTSERPMLTPATKASAMGDAKATQFSDFTFVDDSAAARAARS